MSLQLDIAVTDEATPVLAQLQRELVDRKGINTYMTASMEAGTRMYLRKDAATRHKTAQRLGASPTGYLTKRAELVEGKATSTGAEITVVGAIFRRVLGPVVIRPREKKMLAIPWRKESYGKRPGEFSDLFVFVSKRGKVFLARPTSTKGKIEFYFLLKSKVTLTQDSTLLPDQQAFGEFAELGARGYLRKILRG